MKSSMNINDYIKEDHVAKADSSGKAIVNYLEYINSLIIELKELYNYADQCQLNLDSIFVCQNKLSLFKRKLNAELLADWYLNYTYELENEINNRRKHEI